MKFLICLVLLFLNGFIGVEGQNQVCSWTGGVLNSNISLQIKQEGCNIIQGNVEVEPTLANFTDLINITKINGYFWILNNPNIKNLHGLDNLIEIGLYVQDNNLLRNLDGWGNLLEIGEQLEIRRCNALQNIDGLRSLKIVGQYIYLVDFASLENIEGLSNLESTTAFALRAPKVKTLGTALSKINTLSGLFWIDGNAALENLGQLNFTSTGNYLRVTNNAVLTNVDSLSSVKTVGTYIQVHSNALLKNIYGLSNIESVGSGSTQINLNPSFDCNSACNQKILSKIQDVTVGALTTDCLVNPQIFDICNNNNYTNNINETLCSNSGCYYCTDFNCTVAQDDYCGDGIIQLTNGEECDQNIVGSFNCEYNQLNCTFCNLKCLIQQGNTSYCGDGIIQPNNGEECDQNIADSFNCEYNQLNCTFCNLKCLIQQGTVSYCGDGIVQQNEGEECDDLSQNCENCRNIIQTTTKTSSEVTSSSIETSSSSVESTTSSVESTSSSVKPSSSFVEVTTTSQNESTFSSNSQIITTQDPNICDLLVSCETNNTETKNITNDKNETIIVQVIIIEDTLQVEENVVLAPKQQLQLNEGDLNVSATLTLTADTFVVPVEIKSGCLNGEGGDLNIDLSDNVDPNNLQKVELISYQCFTKFNSVSVINTKKTNNCIDSEPEYTQTKLSIVFVKNENCNNHSDIIQPNIILYFIVFLYYFYSNF